MTDNNRGIYGQAESNAAVNVAADERNADQTADIGYNSFLTRMVSAVDSEIQASNKFNRGLGGNRPVKEADPEWIALKTQADIVEEMKQAGYALLVAEGTINHGRYERRVLSKMQNGDVASSEATSQEIRIKSDGKGACTLYQTAARNKSVFRHRGYNESFKGTWDATPGTEDAKGKVDAADTGEWFG